MFSTNSRAYSGLLSNSTRMTSNSASSNRGTSSSSGYDNISLIAEPSRLARTAAIDSLRWAVGPINAMDRTPLPIASEPLEACESMEYPPRAACHSFGNCTELDILVDSPRRYLFQEVSGISADGCSTPVYIPSSRVTQWIYIYLLQHRSLAARMAKDQL